MSAIESSKPQSRQQRRLEERKKARSGGSEASSSTQQDQTERGQHRAQLRAATRGRLPAGGSRQPDGATNHIIPISRAGQLPNSTIAAAAILAGSVAAAGNSAQRPSFMPVKARQTFATGTALLDYFQKLDLEDGPTSMEQRHSMKKETDLIKAAADAVRQAAEKIPLYEGFLKDARGKCIDVSAETTKTKDEKQSKAPLVLRTKETAMVDKIEKCQLNLETTVDVWEILFQRLGESMAYWRSPRQDVGKRVADPQQVKLRRDLQLTQDKLEICVRQMLEVHDMVVELMDGVKRGLGQAVQVRKRFQDWESKFFRAAEEKVKGLGSGSGLGSSSGKYPETL